MGCGESRGCGGSGLLVLIAFFGAGVALGHCMKHHEPQDGHCNRHCNGHRGPGPHEGNGPDKGRGPREEHGPDKGPGSDSGPGR